MVNQQRQQDFLRAPAQRRELTPRAALERRGGAKPDPDIGADLRVRPPAARARLHTPARLEQPVAREAAIVPLPRGVGDRTPPLLQTLLERRALLGRLDLVRGLDLPQHVRERTGII